MTATHPPTTRPRVLPGPWARRLSDGHCDLLGRTHHHDGDLLHHLCCGRQPEVGEAAEGPTDAGHPYVGHCGDRDDRQRGRMYNAHALSDSRLAPK